MFLIGTIKKMKKETTRIIVMLLFLDEQI